MRVLPSDSRRGPTEHVSCYVAPSRVTWDGCARGLYTKFGREPPAPSLHTLAFYLATMAGFLRAALRPGNTWHRSNTCLLFLLRLSPSHNKTNRLPSSFLCQKMKDLFKNNTCISDCVKDKVGLEQSPAFSCFLLSENQLCNLAKCSSEDLLSTTFHGRNSSHNVLP